MIAARHAIVTAPAVMLYPAATMNGKIGKLVVPSEEQPRDSGCAVGKYARLCGGVHDHVGGERNSSDNAETY